MKLQKASRFAVYAVLELAANPERQLSAAQIAEKYGISTNHLAKVLAELGRARLVEAVRGAGGGYRFSGNVKRITLMDVIELFEEIDARHRESAEPGEHTEVGVALRMVLGEIDDIAQATLRSISLDTMLKIVQKQGVVERIPSAGPRAVAN